MVWRSKGVDSYASISYMKTAEDVEDDWYYNYFNAAGDNPILEERAPVSRLKPEMVVFPDKASKLNSSESISRST